MGKRNVVVVVSSSEEEEVDVVGIPSCITNRINPGSSLPRSTSRTSKRPRRSHSLSHSGPKLLGDFDRLCEDFYDGFQESRKVTGSGRKVKTELWVDKYRPHSLAELAVQKKKVEEVKTWLNERLVTSKETVQRNALVITGQAGVGKSATVNVIASHLGANVYEWNTPTPTLWQEHMHNLNSGVQYMSKLDEFENFVERIIKYPLLPLSSIDGSMKPTVLLIDDLPLTNGNNAVARLCNCLNTLVGSVQFPTIILVTEYTKADSRNTANHGWEGLLSSLESAGACKMAFNPITVNSIKKTLSRICKEEQCNVTAEQIDQIAKVSGGDIRHAITSLQYFCLTPGQLLPSKAIHSRNKADEFKMLDDSALSFGRDETLSLFHALGKFLHNKREVPKIASFEEDIFDLGEKFARLPLKMDAPEEIISQANGQARPIAEFLHENILDFLNDEAVDDAWTVASYLCDADNLLATFRGSTWSQMTNTYELENIPQSAAASVAVRGVLFGNSHPAQSRWHAIRSPKIWQVEQLSRRNKAEMIRQRNEAYSGLTSSDLFVVSTEYRPFLRWLGPRALEAPETHREQMQRCENGEDESENDEIEDW